MVTVAQKMPLTIDRADYSALYTSVQRRETRPGHVFYLGVRSTGIVCHPECSAKTPGFEQCAFFSTLQDALLEGYRPCKRCKPVSRAISNTKLVAIIDRIHAQPDLRWKRSDFLDISPQFDPEDRLFHRVHGFRILAYARARRLGLLFRQCRFIHAAPQRSRTKTCILDGRVADDTTHNLSAVLLQTPIGTMLAIASSEQLYLLEFLMRRGLETELYTIQKRYNACILAQKNKLLETLQNELGRYFAGEQPNFTLPLKTDGTPFQEHVWQILRAIPCGNRASYTEIAQKLDKPTAVRAVGRANGANRIAILIPCHRVLQKNGELGGYGGGLARKAWLLDHEKNSTPQTSQ